MNSPQLDFWQEELDALPWQGRSPRGLTRAALALFFKRERQKNERFFVDPNQLGFFRVAEKAPRVVPRGAPSLLPFPADQED